ncbi:PREDICTED: uncharacterized protein LOC109222444, partial [Nicotiana attenuata]|uniref:uncharacterized protein LOC109222444 n=1 Tax=Nicotiana attenuata TaxID=49451 RepID=UPI000905544C
MKESTNDLIKKLLIDNQQLRTDFRNLQRQMGQLAMNQNTRPAGALPRDTEKNPQVNAVTLRNGRELEEVPKKRKDKATPEGGLIPKETHKSKNTDAIPEPIQLNIPLVDVLRETPKYAKYIKDVVAHKKRLNEFETVALTEECTSRVENKLPQKLKDPGSFTIPVRIGNIDLADRSITHPEGMIDDVLLQIGKFIFPTDFIILHYEANELVPIILGRPLLATSDAIIKVREGKIILRVDDEEAVFNVYKAIQLPRHYEELSMISVVEVDEQILDTSVYLEDSLEKALMLFNSMGNDEEVEEMMHILDTSCAYMHGIRPFEPLNRPDGPPPKPSIEEAPKLELKPLPPHLQYAYLGDSDTLPVIVYSELLLEKDISFKFDDACLKEFEDLKGRLVTAPIIIAPDWEQPFELMCDA